MWLLKPDRTGQTNSSGAAKAEGVSAKAGVAKLQQMYFFSPKSVRASIVFRCYVFQKTTFYDKFANAYHFKE
jgi:hypothetical protein